MNETTPFSSLVAAVFRLAAARAWSTVTLADIAAEAGLTLSDLVRQAASKIEVLARMAREIDERLLESLAADPVDGEPHDRLFDVLLRRLEMLTPHKTAIASIVAGSQTGPLDALSFLGTALESVNRLLVAARFETSGTRGDLLRLGLVKVQADMLRTWLDDDDPGLAKTMAQLDRRLRDTESLTERLEAPFKILSGLMRAFRPAKSKSQQDGSNATAD